jgi:RNA polymerase sigma-70 factor, ECF subfamily
MGEELAGTIEALYRAESGRILATLTGLLGNFDLAEDAMQEAFAAAARQWPQQGIPDNPRAWLVSTGRFKAIDALRRRARFDASVGEITLAGGEPLALREESRRPGGGRSAAADLHLLPPGSAPEARVALTLREVCGLTTEEIARAFLTSPPDPRAAHRAGQGEDPRRAHPLRGAGPRTSWPERLDAVLQVIYLVFNEGYSASSGEALTRADLSGEAIRLGRLLLELLPEPEVMGLLALMLLHESRRAARTSSAGDLVLLEDQDRGSVEPGDDRGGGRAGERRAPIAPFRAYTLQAAISAVHAEAPTAAATDWGEIVGLYDVLLG